MVLNAEILPGDLEQIVSSVCGTMMDLEVNRCDAGWFPARDRWTAAVHLSGNWNGAVLLECSPEQARWFAGSFPAMDSEESVEEMVPDALGELVNMIGGNLKCLLPTGAHISLPAVVKGSDYALSIRGAEVQRRLAFQCVAGRFWVTVLATRG